MRQQVLVIEDEAQTRDIFLDCLNLKGFDAIGASDGQLGLALAQQHLPSLIVCDILMPEMNGYQVLSALRENPKTAMIPLVFLTAKNSTRDIRKGMQLGADDYISKPSTLGDFLKTVSTQIEKRSLLQSCYEAKFKEEAPDREINREADREINREADRETNREPSCETGRDRKTIREVADEFDREGDFVESAPLEAQTIFPAGGPLQPVFDFIESNYQTPITLTDVAQAVGYSPAYLTSQVGEQTGHTVNRWIIERRMAAARSLLKTTDYKIEEIATIIGYQHACHFSRQFRKHHGQPPNAWRGAQLSEQLVSQ